MIRQLLAGAERAPLLLGLPCFDLQVATKEGTLKSP